MAAVAASPAAEIQWRRSRSSHAAAPTNGAAARSPQRCIARDRAEPGSGSPFVSGDCFSSCLMRSRMFARSCSALLGGVFEVVDIHLVVGRQ